MYEPGRHIDTFFVAGFQHHDGALVLGGMKVGDSIALVPEPDNPYDPQAVALRFAGTMIGYVPRDKNALVATFAYYGHAGAFECRILQVNPEADPWNQVRVGLYVTDARDAARKREEPEATPQLPIPPVFRS